MEVLWIRFDRVVLVIFFFRDIFFLGLVGWGLESKVGGKVSDWYCWGLKIMLKDKDIGV